MKKIYSFLLVLLMAVMSVNTAQATEEIIYDGGSWSIQRGSSFLTSNTAICLNIKDASVCQDYTSTSATPWASYKDEIEEVFFRFEGDNFKVGKYMFADMPELVGVWRWSGKCKIMDKAFQNCPKLYVCQIIMDATKIGDYAFENCSTLIQADFENITSIGKYAFAGCTSLKKAVCYKGVTGVTIGERAFSGCESLYDPCIDLATSIGDYAFNNCYALETANMQKCSSVGAYAFRNCNLNHIVLGTRLTSIGDYAFQYAINDNADITAKNSIPPTLGSNVFYGVNCNKVWLWFADESYAYAYSDSPWSQFKHNADGVPTYGVFSADGKTMVLYSDNQMTSRGGYDQWWWESARENVEEVILDASMENARPTSTANWFSGFINLTYIYNLGYLHTDRVTSMYEMFYNCKKLTSISLAHMHTSNVTSFDGMFSKCESLTEIDVNPLDLSSATDTYFMFGLCTNLEKIYCDKDWSQYSIALSHSMFDRCTSLRGGKGTEYNSSKIGLNYARPDGGPDAPGYFWRADDDGINHQDIDNVQSDKVQSTKVIRDGMLLIERNGKTYNAQGVEVK